MTFVLALAPTIVISLAIINGLVRVLGRSLTRRENLNSGAPRFGLGASEVPVGIGESFQSRPWSTRISWSSSSI